MLLRFSRKRQNDLHHLLFRISEKTLVYYNLTVKNTDKYSYVNFSAFSLLGLSVKDFRSQGGGDLSSADIFTEEVNFLRFCADTFYGRPLFRKAQGYFLYQIKP